MNYKKILIVIISFSISCNNYNDKDRQESFRDAINQEFTYQLVEKINWHCYRNVNKNNIVSELDNSFVKNIVFVNKTIGSLEYFVFIKETDSIISLIHYKNEKIYTYDSSSKYVYNR